MPKTNFKTSRRVTVKDIAEEAGVSIGSVSTVLNNHQEKRRISEDTVAKIRAATMRLGYMPNIGARRLRSLGSGKSPVVLAVVTSYEAPLVLIHHFLGALRRAVNESASAKKYVFSVVIEMFPAGKLKEMKGILSGEHFNGAMILNTTADDDRFLSAHRLNYPVVFVNRLMEGYSSVMEDSDAGARAAEILVKGGRKKFAVLHGSPFTQITRIRVESFMNRVRELTGTEPMELVAPELSAEGAYDVMWNLLKDGPVVDGLYAVSDTLALGAYQAIKNRGFSIPGKMGVVGVGDFDFAPFFDPPLSCVGGSHKELAEAAAKLLLKQLDFRGMAPEVEEVPLVEALRNSTRVAG